MILKAIQSNLLLIDFVLLARVALDFFSWKHMFRRGKIYTYTIVYYFSFFWGSRNDNINIIIDGKR